MISCGVMTYIIATKSHYCNCTCFSVPDAARTSFASSGNENVRKIKEVEEEKPVPSADSFRVTLLWCGPVVFFS